MGNEGCSTADWSSSRRLILDRSPRQQIVASLDVHPAVTLTHPSRTGMARMSDVRNVVTPNVGRIVLRRRNARLFAGAFKRRNGLRPGRIPAQALYLRTVDAVVHAARYHHGFLRAKLSGRPASDNGGLVEMEMSAKALSPHFQGTFTSHNATS